MKLHCSRFFSACLAGCLFLGGFLSCSAPASAQSASQAAALIKRFESLSKAGRYQEAIPVGKQLLTFVEKNFGSSHLNTAAVAHDVGVMCQQTGDLEQAEKLYRRALGIWRKSLGSSHQSTAHAMSNLGVLCLARERYAEAEELLSGALKVFEKKLGKSAALVGVVANNLGLIYEALGDYPQAEASYARALEIIDKSKSDEHNMRVRCLTNLGSLHQTMGNHAKAEPLLQRAVAEAEKKWPKGHPDMVHPLAAMAAFHYTLGDYAAAEPFQARAIQLAGEKLGEEHFEMATVIGNMGLIFLEREDYPRAIALFTKALEITEKSLGPDHSRIVLHLGNLGLAQRGAKDHAKASESLNRALKLAREGKDRDDTLTATVLNNLGLLASDLGHYDEAETHYVEALALLEKALGPGHPRAAALRENLVISAIGRQKPEEARTRAAEWDQATRQVWDSLLAFTSEAQREAAQRTDTFQTFDTLGTLGDGPLLAEAALWRKGAVLESLIEERLLATAADADKALAAKQKEADSLRGRLHQALLEENAAGLPEERIKQARTRLDTLQKEMARQVTSLGQARSGLKAVLSEVRERLPREAVLVEIVRYGHHLGKGESEPRYAAAVVPAPGRGEPAYVALGEAEPLETLVTEFRALASRPLGGDETAAARDAALEAKARALHTRLVPPLEKALPEGTREIIISPDGSLHFVPFAALLDGEGKFWGEKHLLWTVSTGRDLLKPAGEPLTAPASVVLLGNPDYASAPPEPAPAAKSKAASSKKKGAASKAPPAPPSPGPAQERFAGRFRAGLGQAVDGISFEPLPGTAAEVDALKTRFEGKGWSVQTWVAGEASESALRGLEKAPAVLHLATHGFFLGEGNASPAAPGADAAAGPAPDSMLRGGLALAHAGHTIGEWQAGKVPPLERDGILTAAEAAGLPLRDTRLVALSACDTGLGEVRSGEGVLGLKRGFAVAGARNLLMTLWEISDDDTVALMADFYDRLLAGDAPPQALSVVQVEALKKLRTEKGLHHAINRAAPFVMVGGGVGPPAGPPAGK